MKLNSFLLMLLAVSGIILTGTSSTLAQTEESRWGDEKKEKTGSIVLTRRTDNGAYGTSAFSFLKATQEIDEHRNYVDLVFNGCGLLHFNPVSGHMDSRIADLGEAELGVKYDEDDDRFWAEHAFPPQEGHVYLHKVKIDGQQMTVKFRLNEVSVDELKIDWLIVKEVSGTARGGGGMAGTMGQCGGAHAAR